MRWLNVNNPNEPTEEDYYQFALMELGGDTLNWYGLIDVSQGMSTQTLKLLLMDLQNQVNQMLMQK